MTVSVGDRATINRGRDFVTASIQHLCATTASGRERTLSADLQALTELSGLTDDGTKKTPEGLTANGRFVFTSFRMVFTGNGWSVNRGRRISN